MHRPPTAPEPREHPALPRDLVVFFIQFSVALNKSRSYPAGHPVLTASMEVLSQHLTGIVQRNPVFTVGVSRRQLMVEGLPTDDQHPVVRDLADRLHHHQLAAVQFRQGIGMDELADLVRGLATESWRQGKPLGLQPLAELMSRWPHVTLEPLPLDQLELGDDTGAARQSDRIWQGLVNAAMLFAQESAAGGAAGPTPATPADIARAIKARRGDAVFNRAVVDWMLQMGDEVAATDTGSPLREKVDELFNELDPQTLHNVLELGATPEQRRRLLMRGAKALPVQAVLDLVHAAGTTAERNPSHALVRMLGKLASHVDRGRGPVVLGAEEVVRDSVRHLVGDWQLDDPASPQHRRLLELLAEPGKKGATGSGGKVVTGALRLTQLCLELGLDSPSVAAALDELRVTIPFQELLGLWDHGRAAGLAMGPVWEAITTPAYLQARLLDEEADLERLGQILEQLGPPGVTPLLDALEIADSSSRRRWLLTRLEAHREGLAPQLVARLPGKPWFVIRNLLNLLGTLGELPPGFTPEPYAEHEDMRVRREAYRLLFADPRWRAAGLGRALADPDPQTVRMALNAITEPQPALELQTRLLEALRGGLRDPEDRVAAIRLLGRRPIPAACDWLRAQVTAESRFLGFRRQRLLPKSPEMLAALPVLRAHFARHAEVARALTLASRSRDPEIRAAVARTATP